MKTQQDVQQMITARNHYQRMAEETGSRFLAEQYRRNVWLLNLDIAAAMRRGEWKTEEPRSDNAMRMEMDPPSAKARPVQGALQGQRERNAEAVLRQAADALMRGDGKHAQDLIERAAGLREAA